MSAHRKPGARPAAWLYQVARVGPCVATPAGVVVMVTAVAVTHSTALFVLGAVASVSGWIALTLQGRTR